MSPRNALIALGSFVVFAPLAGGASAADEVEATVTIKDHKFEPTEIKVPAGKAVKITVKNLDATAEEFESSALKIEKVVGANSTAVVRVKPLTKGSYAFVGEYHEASAKGTIVAE